jgi:hypothetical protein
MMTRCLAYGVSEQYTGLASSTEKQATYNEPLREFPERLMASDPLVATSARSYHIGSVFHHLLHAEDAILSSTLEAGANEMEKDVTPVTVLMKGCTIAFATVRDKGKIRPLTTMIGACLGK